MIVLVYHITVKNVDSHDLNQLWRFSISIELQLQSILEKVQKQKLIKPPLDYFNSCMVKIFLEISKERVCVF